MRKPFKVALFVLVGGILLIQFFQPERNLGSRESDSDLAMVLEVPDTLALLIENSCYDCHSNRTDYPWYSHISPVSWFLEMHIRDGKEKLNLSNFGNLEKSRKIGAIADICDELETGKMPLKSYLFLHGEARLTTKEREEICSWLDSEALKIMKQ